MLTNRIVLKGLAPKQLECRASLVGCRAEVVSSIIQGAR